MNRLDYDLREAILKSTDKALESKNDVLQKLRNEIKGNYIMKRRKTGNKFGIIAAVLILLLAAGLWFTPTGQAAVSRIIDLFEKEKSVETIVEGQPETTEQELIVGNTPTPQQDMMTPDKVQMTYVMYVDTERYIIETEDGADIIKPADYPEDMPEVYMKITQVDDISMQNALSAMLAEINAEYETVSEPYEVGEPLKGICIDAFDGDPNGTKETMPQWDSAVTKVIIVDNTQGGVFIIEMKYFIEAEEGHGSRFLSMLEEFVIVPSE
ncbi:MAG: hypothetical protein JXN65_04595 [Clostridia bacterium]|nr:hypothetical protein [Clostridia bacterium]